MAIQPVLDVRHEALRGEALRSDVLRLMGFILRRPIASDENPSRETEPGWDSLKHVELVFLIEDHFGVRFSIEEMAEIKDAEQIMRLLEARREA